jgi:hypothetical protein
VKSTLEDFTTHKFIEFVCKASGHTNRLSVASFGNKKSKVDIRDFCTECKADQTLEQRAQTYKTDIHNRFGHTVTTVNFSTREVEYVCGNCQATGHTFISNFERTVRTPYCPKCQNDSNKLTYEEIKRRVEEKGMTLLTKKEEYKNNKQKLKLICCCGNENYESVLSEIKRDRNCKGCKTAKYEKSCLEKYQVRNASQHPDVLDKIFSYERKSYTFPSGKVVFVQGWETFALDTLLNTYSETDICLGKDIPRINYTMSGKEHIYFPDMYIKSVHTIIEVKSLYTYNFEKDKNYQKFLHVLNQGYNLRIMIYINHPSKLQEFYYTPSDMLPEILV